VSSGSFAETVSLISLLSPELVNWKEKLLSSELKIAVIGFGKMGLLHSGILNLLVPGSVKAIVDKSFLLSFGAPRLIKSIRFYRDIEEMLDKIEPSVAYVTTPTNSHYSIVKSLLEHGVKYVFVEKPPTLSYKQLQSIISTKKHGQIVMVGFQKKYALTFRHARLLLEKNVIGEVKKVTAYIKSGDILEPTKRFDTLGKGVLLDLGVHLVDLLTWFFKVKRIVGTETKSLYTRVDDMFTAELEAEGGFNVSMEASWSNSDYRVPETYIEIQGSKGVIRVTEDYLKVSTDSKNELLDYKREVAFYKPHYYRGVPPVNLADPEYTIEDIHFLESIREGREPLTSLEKSSETMKLIEELYEVAGKRVQENG
jgi:predicted dehydrogenase